MATQIRKEQIGDGEITNAQIAIGAGIAYSKLNVSGSIADADLAGSISTANLAEGSLFIQSGGSVAMAANLAMGSNKITGLGTPSAATDAATKDYVDALAQGLAVHDPCRAGSTSSSPATLSSYTYNNGTAGVGATLTADSTATSHNTIDDVLLVVNNRVLIKDDTASVAQVNPISTVADSSGSLNNTYFWLFTGDGGSNTNNSTAYYVWFNVSAGGSDPNPTSPYTSSHSNTVGVEVAIATDDTASAVATAVRIAVAALDDFSAAGGTNNANVTHTNAEEAIDAEDGSAATGFTFGGVTEGKDAGYRNGIYTVTTLGDAGSNSFKLTRATDFDHDPNAEIHDGDFFFIQEGTTNNSNGYVQTNNWGTSGFSGTVGETGINWAQFSGAGQITAGTGLTKSGNTLNVGDAGKGIQVNADDLEISASEMVSSTGGLSAAASSWELEIDLSTLSSGSATTILTTHKFAFDDSGTTKSVTFADILADLDIVTITSNGIVTRTAADTYAARTISDATNGGIAVTNGDGVSGNPELAIDISDLASGSATTILTTTKFAFDDSGTTKSTTFADILVDLDIVTATSNGMLARTAADTYASRTLTSSSTALQEGIVISNGDGVSGNPTIGLDIESLTGDETPGSTDEFVYSNGTNNRKITFAGIEAALTVENLASAITNNQVVTGTGTAVQGETNLTFDGNTLTVAGDIVATDTSTAALTVQNSADAVSNQIAIFKSGDKTTAADDDEGYLTFQNEDSAGNMTEFSRATWVATDVTNTSKNAQLKYATMKANTLTTILTVGANVSGVSGITLESGATINEFSTDGTLGDNSDVASPTEKAVKTYVDTQVTGVTITTVEDEGKGNGTSTVTITYNGTGADNDSGGNASSTIADSVTVTDVFLNGSRLNDSSWNQGSTTGDLTVTIVGLGFMNDDDIAIKY